MKALPASLLVSALSLCAAAQQPPRESGSHPQTKPNVLLITVDTLRADHLHCYGYPRVETPVIDRLAGDSVLFTHTYTPVPLTLPAHASLLTGCYPTATGVHDYIRSRLSKRAATLASVLHDHGYQTAAFVSAIVLDARFGLNAGFDTYFDRFDTVRFDAAQLGAMKRRGDETVNVALGWLREHAGPRASAPFFLWIHLFDPHRPYTAPQPFAERYRTHPYDGEIAFDDAQVGRLEAWLQAQGLWKRTLVVLTADHGEGLGEHGEEQHGFFIYNSTLHVPLIMHFPSVAPRTVAADVSLVDVMPTVLQALQIPAPPGVQGHSLLPLALGQTSTSDSILYAETYLPLLHFGWSELRGLQAHGLRYIEAPRPELYSLDSDPNELHNLDRQRPESGSEMRRQLISDLKLLTPPGRKPAAEEGPADPALIEQLRSLGYLAALPRQSSGTGGQQLADPKDRIGVYQLYLHAASDTGQGWYRDSLRELRRAQKIDSTSPFLDYLEGFDYFRLREYQEAKRKLQAATSLDPKFALATYYLGRAQFRLAEFDGAIVSFRRALNEDGANFAAAYHLGKAYRSTGRLSEAVRSFQRAVQLKPDYILAYQALGEAYLEQDEPQAAATALERAVRLEPDLAAAHYDLGRAYQILGRAGDAAREFERANAHGGRTATE